MCNMVWNISVLQAEYLKQHFFLLRVMITEAGLFSVTDLIKARNMSGQIMCYNKAKVRWETRIYTEDGGKWANIQLTR